MDIQKETKLFAFKLAEKQTTDAKPATQWKVREGVSIAGCCDLHGDGLPRVDDELWGPDQGFYC